MQKEIIMRNKDQIRKIRFSLILCLLVFALTACSTNGGSQASRTNSPSGPSAASGGTTKPDGTDAVSVTTTAKAAQATTAALKNQFLPAIEPQALYDQDKIKVTLDVFPGMNKQTYRVTAVNESDQAILISLDPFTVDDISLPVVLVKNGIGSTNAHLNAGETGIYSVRFGTVTDGSEKNYYQRFGFGELGDFSTRLRIKDDLNKDIVQTQEVTIKTDRGVVPPKTETVTKNLLLDEGGIKLYLAGGEHDIGFNVIELVFYYENTLDSKVNITSTSMLWDGKEHDTKLYNSLTAGKKGFFEHDIDVDDLAEANIRDPKKLEIAFDFLDTADSMKKIIQTDPIDLKLEQFPLVQVE